MIVIRKPLYEGQTPKITYDMEKDENGLTFSFKTTYMDRDVADTVVLPFETYKGKILQVTLQMTDGVETRVYPLYEIQSRYHILSANNNDAMMLARISIADDCEDIVVYLDEPTDYTDEDAQVIDKDAAYSKSYMMKLYSPFYARKMERNIKKWNMMESLDIYNTVTYLESQVDALTRLVLQLGDEAEIKQILTAANEHSVLDVKQATKIIDELRTDKRQVRELQRDYYDKA